MLDAGQRARATIAARTFGDIVTRNVPKVDPMASAGLPAAGMTAGQPRQPRRLLHGPTVLVEYDNSQSSANHIHTVWRDLENDFGGDLLRQHYARQPHRE